MAFLTPGKFTEVDMTHAVPPMEPPVIHFEYHRKLPNNFVSPGVQAIRREIWANKGHSIVNRMVVILIESSFIKGSSSKFALKLNRRLVRGLKSRRLVDALRNHIVIYHVPGFVSNRAMFEQQITGWLSPGSPKTSNRFPL